METTTNYNYSDKTRTIIININKTKFTNNTFSIICKDCSSKEVLIEKLKSSNPTNFDINRSYFFIINIKNIPHYIWRQHQTRIESYIDYDLSGCGGGHAYNFVDNVFPLDINASILIENNHILYVLDETLLKILQSIM